MTTRIYIWVIAIIISIYALISTAVWGEPSGLGLAIAGGVLVTAWFLSNQIGGGDKPKKPKIISRNKIIIHKRKLNINMSDIWSGVALIVIGLLIYAFVGMSSGTQPSIFVLTPALIGAYLIFQAFMPGLKQDSKDSNKSSTIEDKHKIIKKEGFTWWQILGIIIFFGGIWYFVTNFAGSNYVYTEVENQKILSGEYVQLSGDSWLIKTLNIRSGPGVNYEIINTYQPNTKIQAVLGTNIGSTKWYKVIMPDENVGWVLGGGLYHYWEF